MTSNIPHLDIVRKGESQNASASGIIKISDQWIVGVRAEKSLDFFVLNGDITSPENKFESIGSIGIAENDIGEFQSINLFTDADDELYFVGFCPDKINNSAELIKVETKRNDAGKIVVVVKADSLAKKEFDTIDDGVKFKYAAGMKFVPEANSPKDKAKGKFQVFSACGYVDNTKIVLNSWE